MKSIIARQVPRFAYDSTLSYLHLEPTLLIAKLKSVMDIFRSKINTHVRHCTHCILKLFCLSHHFQLTIIRLSNYIFMVPRLILDTESVKLYDAGINFDLGETSYGTSCF